MDDLCSGQQEDRAPTHTVCAWRQHAHWYCNQRWPEPIGLEPKWGLPPLTDLFWIRVSFGGPLPDALAALRPCSGVPEHAVLSSGVPRGHLVCLGAAPRLWGGGDRVCRDPREVYFVLRVWCVHKRRISGRLAGSRRSRNRGQARVTLKQKRRSKEVPKQTKQRVSPRPKSDRCGAVVHVHGNPYTQSEEGARIDLGVFRGKQACFEAAARLRHQLADFAKVDGQGARSMAGALSRFREERRRHGGGHRFSEPNC